MNYYFVSEATDKILDILFCPDKEATVTEIEAVARPLANLTRGPVRVLKGENMGLTFRPCLGHERDEGPKGTLTAGDLMIDLDRHIVTVRGRPVHLTPTEFALLICLANSLDFVVSYQELVAQARKRHCSDEDEAREIIRPHIKNLRRKIEPDPTRFIYIVNVRGVGYRLRGRSDCRPHRDGQSGEWGRSSVEVNRG